MRRNVALCTFAILWAMSADVGAYNPSGTGAEPHFWDNHAIVICRVLRARVHDDGKARLQLKVLAVALTEQMVPAQLEFDCHPGRESGGFWPKRRETYVLCIRMINGTWQYGEGVVTFFKSGGCMEKITGLDDPELKPLLERLAKAHAESRKNTVRYDETGERPATPKQ